MQTVESFAPILGVIVGGGITYAAQWEADRRRAKRDAIEGVARLFDSATQALATVEASRRGARVTLNRAHFPELSPWQLAAAEVELSMEGLRRYQKSQWDLRATMAALPDAEGFQRFWDRDSLLSEGEVEEALRLVAERRRQLFVPEVSVTMQRVKAARVVLARMLRRGSAVTD
jgi:hypothetical protein